MVSANSSSSLTDLQFASSNVLEGPLTLKNKTSWVSGRFSRRGKQESLLPKSLWVIGQLYLMFVLMNKTPVQKCGNSLEKKILS